MQQPATDILDIALALHRSPGERFRLRERPLHPDIIRLIEIAAGLPQSLREAAEEVGEPDALVLDAAHFYLEQVLFADPHADAYRLLGVDRDAAADSIRRHHRLLQRWLHPDRAQAGDASVFATRVNQAWSQLRGAEARQAYDAKLATIGAGQVGAPEAAAPIRLWQGDAPESQAGRGPRWLLGAALVACGVLGGLMYRQQVNGGLATADREPGGAAAEVRALPVAIELDAGSGAGGDGSALREALAGMLEPAVDVLPEVEAGPGAVRAAEPVFEPIAAVAAATKELAPAAIAASAAPRMEIAPAPIAVSAAAPPGPRPPVPGPPPPTSTLLAERLRMAEQRLGQVTAYLASAPDAAPMWNDPATAEQAARLRARFGRYAGCPQFDTSDWRLHPDNAHASAGWRCRRERGTLDVELVWREGMWLVRGIALAPAA